MKLIAGLGNPGIEYRDTRHNIGFLAVENICTKENISIQRKKFNCLFGSGFFGGQKVLTALPLTYMNRSGEAIQAIASYYDIRATDLIVIHDDMDFDLGTLKIKTSGGSAGHRGVDSIIKCLGEDNFIRIRAGIGKPQGKIDPADYVLKRFLKDEKEVLKEVIQGIEECVKTILSKGVDFAMNRFHGITKSSP